MTITNLQEAAKLNVNIYEIENSILGNESSYKNHDNTFFFMAIPTLKLSGYEPQRNEVVLNTERGISIIVKKV